MCTVFFFFSSRRRHTRYWRDWSSDVCSSDLLREPMGRREVVERHDRCEAAGEASVDDRLVVRERFLGELPFDRLDARPLHGEAIGVEVHPGDEVEVRLPQLPPVRRLARRLTADRGRHVLEEPRVARDVVALVLVTGGGDSPEEVGGEGCYGHEWS